MIRLHNGSGSWEIQLLGQHLPENDWLKLRANVGRLLKARRRPGTGLLDMFPWELRDGTNWFADEFCVLYTRLPVDRYVEAAELEHNSSAREAAKAIADAFGELGTFVRFVAFEPHTEDAPIPVAAPELEASAVVVARSLNDAERLLQTNGAVSAVDRVHTALHGYLKELCRQADIELTGSESMTLIWKHLRSKHPVFEKASGQSAHLARIISGVSTILDALNPIRNNASMAHPNDELLGEPEAMLVVNSARTLLHYLDAITRTS